MCVNVFVDCVVYILLAVVYLHPYKMLRVELDT